MRRCLRCLLVGVLAFSLAIDVATACGRRAWRSHCCPPRGAAVAMSMPVSMGYCRDGSTGMADCACGSRGPQVTVVLGDACGGCPALWCEEIACGIPVAEAPWGVAVVETPTLGGERIVAEHPPAADSVVVESDVPTPQLPERTPEPLAAVPDLEPVEPASATEPTGVDDEPAPVAAPEMADEQPAADEPAPVVEPAPRRNVFEEADETVDEELEAPVEPGADAEPRVEPPFTVDPDPAENPAAETIPDPAAEDAPAVEEPGLQPDSEPQAGVEPLRRWIDDTASFTVVGRLIDVRGDAVEIRRTDGRDVTVPLDRLSGFDRGYVAEARERIAAARLRLPDPLATAGR